MTFDPTPNSINGSGTDTAFTPGELRVIKRTKQVVPYDESKISNAIFQAYASADPAGASNSSSVQDKVRALTHSVTTTFQRRLPSGGVVDIEDIQDQVELSLMRAADHHIARAYVLYREERSKERQKLEPQAAPAAQPERSGLKVQEPDGSIAILDEDALAQTVAQAVKGLEGVDAERILSDMLNSLYDGVQRAEVDKALILAPRALVEQEPNYSFVAARLLNALIHREVLNTLQLQHLLPQVAAMDPAALKALYPQILSAYLQRGIDIGYLDPTLSQFDPEALGQLLDPVQDLKFTYLGLQTLYDRYLLHDGNQRYELPQMFFLRVAMGLALNEDDKTARASEYYSLLSSFDYMSSTPTLFNAGTTKSQLSSCYLSTVPDDLSGIFGAVHENAMLSKWAGGLGNDWTPVRALGSHIQGTNGESQGVVPFLKVVSDTAVAVNQGGKRKGAVCCYLESWHLDIEEFLELRKNTGDDRRRTHDMHTANWIPDLFMKRVEEQGDWTLLSPSSAPDLHDLTGKAFEERYRYYEQLAEAGEITPSKKVKAVDLWRRMIIMLFETGHPWLTFKDACNLRSPQQHCGRIHSSNLCTEITLNTSAEETAVCNLGSVNLVNHMVNGQLDIPRLRKTIGTAMRMLDNVIDINYYAVDKARRSNLKHRPVGLGLMGFQDALYSMGIAYGSPEAVAFADRSMEQISYLAIEASADLALERGSYESYEGSLWSQGILPIDSIELLRRERGDEYLGMDTQTTLDWDSLRAKVKAQGMRNSNVMAIAPTATIANIIGVSPCIEPTYHNLYSKSNLSGEFTVINSYLVKRLKELGIWDDAMRADLKYYDGSVQQIQRIPEAERQLFATCFEIPAEWIVEAASRRQKWIDQSQSLNLYFDDTDGKKLDIIYRKCWQLGLKTTYYLRTLGATATEKASSARSHLNAVSAQQPQPESSAAPSGLPTCRLDDPDCDACE